jgi:hypothetical protein
MNTDIIEGDVVDTYGGDYTYLYVYAEEHEGVLSFYRYCMGAKPESLSKVYDPDDIAEYTRIYERNNPK